ncbi:hypothetical protein GCM10027436_32350 [Actinophytocola sediminis]
MTSSSYSWANESQSWAPQVTTNFSPSELMVSPLVMVATPTDAPERRTVTWRWHRMAELTRSDALRLVESFGIGRLRELIIIKVTTSLAALWEVAQECGQIGGKKPESGVVAVENNVCERYEPCGTW